MKKTETPKNLKSGQGKNRESREEKRGEDKHIISAVSHYAVK